MVPWGVNIVNFPHFPHFPSNTNFVSGLVTFGCTKPDQLNWGKISLLLLELGVKFCLYDLIHLIKKK